MDVFLRLESWMKWYNSGAFCVFRPRSLSWKWTKPKGLKHNESRSNDFHISHVDQEEEFSPLLLEPRLGGYFLGQSAANCVNYGMGQAKVMKEMLQGAGW